jgi:hypothetical protein
MTSLRGDADVFVATYDPSSGKPFVFPKSTDWDTYFWASRAITQDQIRIRYFDAHFCYNCDYVVGVYGYRNASYTMLVTMSDDDIILLLPGRPQMSYAKQGSTRYDS